FTVVKFIQLTRSKLRQKILAYYFTNPAKQLYVRQLASILEEDPGNLSKELSKLENDGMFIAETKGNQKHYCLNEKYPLYNEIRSILFKTVGVEGRLKDIIGGIKGIELSFIYGSFAAHKENASSDIDLLIVGNPNEDELLERIESAEEALGREINYNIYPAAEFKSKRKKDDNFIANILKRPKIILKGDLDAI
ncbi:MAG: nucleotidyltransferase domain-containing protein, partial [Candidatus Omnitrophica bacterium]|nr:nucleotidyltransferase domain-containing protein [Candidatus Omnitrophota bacterium]